jgi:hypothetical protein
LEEGFFRYLTKPIRVKSSCVPSTSPCCTPPKATPFNRLNMANNEMPMQSQGTAMLEAAEILNAIILIVDVQEANVMLRANRRVARERSAFPALHRTLIGLVLFGSEHNDLRLQRPVT